MLSASREHRVLDPLAVQAEGFGFLRIQGAHQAVFLRKRRLVLGLHRLDDLVDLAVEFGLLGLNGSADLHHLRMPIAVLVRELGFLPLQVADLALQLLDVIVRHHRRHRLDCRRALHGLDLVVFRFLLDAGHLRLRGRAVQVGETLHHDVLAVFNRNRIVLLLVPLERRLALLHLLALIGQAIAQPVGRDFRGREPILGVLLDVGLRVRVGHVGRQHGIGRGEANLDQPAVADRRDRQRPQHLVDVRRERIGGLGGPGDGGRLLRRTEHLPLDPGTRVPDHPGQADRPDDVRARRRTLRQVHDVDRAARKAAALQDPVLGLVVVVVPSRRSPEHRVQGAKALRRVLLDQELRMRLVDGRRAEAVDPCRS